MSGDFRHCLQCSSLPRSRGLIGFWVCSRGPALLCETDPAVACIPALKVVEHQNNIVAILLNLITCFSFAYHTMLVQASLLFLLSASLGAWRWCRVCTQVGCERSWVSFLFLHPLPVPFFHMPCIPCMRYSCSR